MLWLVRRMRTLLIRVKKETLFLLKGIKEKISARSMDEVIRYLIRFKRESALREVFGIDKGRITPFTEEDRLEDRH